MIRINTKIVNKERDGRGLKPVIYQFKVTLSRVSPEYRAFSRELMGLCVDINPMKPESL